MRGRRAGHVDHYTPTTELSSDAGADGEPLKLAWDFSGVHFGAVVPYDRVLR